MEKVSRHTNDLNFDAILLRADSPLRAILFAAGSGGNPERHLPLLNLLVERGCTVIAPYFDRITSPTPSADDLQLRVGLLQAAMKEIGELDLPIVGIGHSIGATLLLGLAGGQMWLQGGQRFPISQDERIKKLVLFTPPTGFFHAPKALEQVHAEVQVWAGSLDTITPPQQLEVLRDELSPKCHFAFNIVEGAGHFSFMNELPPNIVDPMKDREVFLTNLGTEVCNFAMS
jgi:pimeloyl-ACP methyl ester carboxylesterase